MDPDATSTMKPRLLLGLLIPVLGAAAWLAWPRAAASTPRAPVSSDAHHSTATATELAEVGGPRATRGGSPESGARTRIAAPAPLDCEWELALTRIALGGTADATPPAGPPPLLDASATCSLRGRVLAPGGRATLTLRSGVDAGRRIAVGDDGAFELHDLNPGRVVVRVELGEEVAERMVELSPSGSAPELLELDFGATGAASLLLVDHLGNPVEDARLRLDGRELRTDAEGRARLERAPLGPAWCEASHGEHARAGFELQVGSDSSRQAEELVELAPGAHVEISAEGDWGDAELVVVVVPSVAKAGPSDAQLAVPWWTFEPLRLARGEKHWLSQLPPGRHLVVPYLDGVRQRGKHAIVDLPVGRLRVARLVLDRPACDPLAGQAGCADGGWLAWRALDRWRRSSEDYDIEAHAAGRLGLPASIGVAGLVRGDGARRWCASRHLLERGAHLGWTICGGRTSAGLPLEPAMQSFGDLREATAPGLVLELPPELAGAALRLRVDGGVRGALLVPSDARLELPGLHGVWRARLSGGTPATARTTLASSASPSPAGFARPEDDGGD
jgi:hypothetical protein